MEGRETGSRMGSYHKKTIRRAGEECAAFVRVEVVLRGTVQWSGRWLGIFWLRAFFRSLWESGSADSLLQRKRTLGGGTYWQLGNWGQWLWLRAAQVWMDRKLIDR